MFRFIHTYTPESFPGLAKAGLWRAGDGLKLMHKPASRPPHDFNTVAAVGSPLERLLSELRCPFYIDRLQGGVGLPVNYVYDPALLSHYDRLLGENFLGLQMHEWASNYRNDCKRITQFFSERGVAPGTEEALRLWNAVEKGEEDLFLEAYSPTEWKFRRLPENRAAFLQDCRELYARRVRETGGRLIPADSYFMAARTEIENGARLLLPEVGWQIPNLRLQLAYTRGMANAAAIPWGIYYECWRVTEGFGLTIPFSLRKGQDEWLEDILHTGNGAKRPPEEREHGGSALSLMARAWRYAYFSGASLIGEEYGVCNTFRDLASFDLSPYGETKRAFLRFTEAFPDLGTPYKSIAAVLPDELPMLDETLSPAYLEFQEPFAPAEPLRAAGEALFGSAGRFGNHGHVLKNGGLPDAVDILHANMEAALSRYPYLIDLTGDPGFRQKHNNCVSVEEADALLSRLLPCRFGGGLHAAYNRTPAGWLVLVMNHEGILKEGLSPEKRLPEAAVTAPVQGDGDIRLSKLAGEGAAEHSENGWFVILPPGGWMLLQIISEKQH